MAHSSGRSAQIAAIVRWFGQAARDLPWRRRPDPWSVLLSEIMLQQTPVTRVIPVFEEWIHRWPAPAALAAMPSGDAVRAWGRLGYPRRAIRLHSAATICTTHHGGRVPSDLTDLRRLPGVGSYTAAAVAAFAFGRREAVLDTNVRRVHARWLDGHAVPATAAPTRAETDRALALLPVRPSDAATASAAVMELGALVCTARSPGCQACPVATSCAWRAAGYPSPGARPRDRQTWTGSDRQCRGQIMAVLRDSPDPVPATALADVWTDQLQRERALLSLMTDGLVVRDAGGYSLP